MNARKPPNWETLSFSDKIAWQCDNPDPAIDYAAMADKHRVKEIVRDKFLVPATFLYARAPEGRSGEVLGLRMAFNNLTHLAVPLFFGAIGSAFGLAPVFLANAVMLSVGGILSRRR